MNRPATLIDINYRLGKEIAEAATSMGCELNPPAEDLASILEACCKNLITVDKGSMETFAVYFVHQDVKDYLATREF